MLPNPWVVLAVVLAWVGSLGIVGYKAYHAGAEHEVATQAKIEKATAEARDLALDRAAEKVAQIDVRNTTIRAKTEVITREVPVYNDCRHDPDGVRNVNAALAGTDEPAGKSELPKADAPR